MRSKIAERYFVGAVVVLALAMVSGCASEKKDPGPHYDYTYFDRQDAARAAERAKVKHEGLWANEDGSGRRFGVILPLSSKLRRAGESVMSGVLAGYWADNPNYWARVTIYKEEQYGNIFAAYKQAVKDGAEVVIGPLTKDAVRSLAETTPIGTPTIALNTASWGNWGEPNLYQFSLSVEEEAVNAARMLFAKGYKRAFMLHEDNEIGERAMKKFEAEMLRLGGGVPETVEFSARSYSYDGPAKRIANATYRVKLFSPNPKELRYAVYRKANAAFIAGDRDGIAGMVWGLRQEGVDDLTIVTTSNANVKDHGVEGVYVIDLPWLVDSQIRSQVWARTDPDFHEEELRLDPRLFAMGMDSYRLAQNLNWMVAQHSRALEGVTGTLSIGPHGRVNRTMALGLITGGTVRNAQLAEFDEKQRKPIHEIVVVDGRERIVPATSASSLTSSWTNPFAGVRF